MQRVRSRCLSMELEDSFGVLNGKRATAESMKSFVPPPGTPPLVKRSSWLLLLSDTNWCSLRGTRRRQNRLRPNTTEFLLKKKNWSDSSFGVRGQTPNLTVIRQNDVAYIHTVFVRVAYMVTHIYDYCTYEPSHCGSRRDKLRLAFVVSLRPKPFRNMKRHCARVSVGSFRICYIVYATLCHNGRGRTSRSCLVNGFL